MSKLSQNAAICSLLYVYNLYTSLYTSTCIQVVYNLKAAILNFTLMPWLLEKQLE